MGGSTECSSRGVVLETYLLKSDTGCCTFFFECRNNTDSDLQAQGKDLERLKLNTVAR